MFTAGQAPDLLVATVADPARPGFTRFVGAAGVGIVYGPGRSFPIMVHVVSSWRGHGIGSRLVEAAVTRCRGRADMIRALQPVPADSQAAMFLTACGFEQLDRLIHWEVDGLPFYVDMLRIRQRLEQHGRVPTNARLLRLRDADPDAVADLVCRCIEAARPHVRARLTEGSRNPYDLDNSVALLIGDELCGVLIYIWNGGVPVIEVRAVDKDMRGTWANALMLEEATRNAKEAGALRFRFFASDKLTDTLSLARRAKAEQIRIELQFGRRLT